MQPWFLWKGESSLDRGIWVSELPAPTRAEERVEAITIPGRAGALHQREGKDIYEEYVREVKITVRATSDFHDLLTWLSGTGQAVFSNEPDRVYDAEISGEVVFERSSNSLKGATIPFTVQPHKGQYPPEPAVSFSASGTLYNPGTVDAKPIITVTFTSSGTVTINGESMTFTAPEPPVNETPQAQTIYVDCDAQIITDDDGLWRGTSEGDFFRLQTGSNTIGLTDATISIKPRWRWY